jgi:hypothetical protein
MKSILGVVVAAALLWLGYAWLGPSRSPPPPDVPFLASDMHFTIGGQHIVLPAVALRGPGHVFDLAPARRESRKDVLRAQAQNPAAPMPTDSIDVSIRQYQYYGEQSASQGICPRLTRAWSQTWCREKPRGLLGRLPEKFDLLDRHKLDRLKSYFTVGRERRYDQVKDMAMRPGVTETGCDRESHFCTAVVEALPGLLAVWSVWPDPNTGRTAEQMAQTEGAAIVQFVQRAIGPTEDATLANAE